MGFSRQGYWSGLAFPPLGDLPNPGTEPACPSWMGKCFTTDPPEEVLLLSHVRLFATPWTVACQAPLSMGVSRQGYWSGLPFPPLGDLPDPGIELRSPALQVGSSPTEPPGKPQYVLLSSMNISTHIRIFILMLDFFEDFCRKWSGKRLAAFLQSSSFERMASLVCSEDAVSSSDMARSYPVWVTEGMKPHGSLRNVNLYFCVKACSPKKRPWW